MAQDRRYSLSDTDQLTQVNFVMPPISLHYVPACLPSLCIYLSPFIMYMPISLLLCPPSTFITYLPITRHYLPTNLPSLCVQLSPFIMYLPISRHYVPANLPFLCTHLRTSHSKALCALFRRKYGESCMRNLDKVSSS